MTQADAEFAVCCAVPLDAPGITVVARPAGRPGQDGATFTGRYGQSTGVVLFDHVFVPHERVFLAGEWEHSGFLTATYATHHRHSCIGARAGFGDLLIGAGVLMNEANGLDASRHGHIRDAMVELIKIVEGFYACGVAASVYGLKAPRAISSRMRSSLMSASCCSRPRSMTCIASPLGLGRAGRGAARSGRRPQSGHAGRLSAVLAGREDIPASRRLAVARLLEDLTASTRRDGIRSSASTAAARPKR